MGKGCRCFGFTLSRFWFHTFPHPRTQEYSRITTKIGTAPRLAEVHSLPPAVSIVDGKIAPQLAVWLRLSCQNRSKTTHLEVLPSLAKSYVILPFSSAFESQAPGAGQ